MSKSRNIALNIHNWESEIDEHVCRDCIIVDFVGPITRF